VLHNLCQELPCDAGLVRRVVHIDDIGPVTNMYFHDMSSLCNATNSQVEMALLVESIGSGKLYVVGCQFHDDSPPLAVYYEYVVSHNAIVLFYEYCNNAHCWSVLVALSSRVNGTILSTNKIDIGISNVRIRYLSIYLIRTLSLYICSLYHHNVINLLVINMN